MPHLNREDILALIPHRFENVLIDEADCTDAGASAALRIENDDPLNRGFFARTDGDEPTLLEHALAEHLALVALCQLGPLGPGELGFFSAINNFQQSGRLPLSEPIYSELTRERDRGAFRRFKGSVLNARKEVVAKADIMAFIMDTTQPQTDERKRLPLPEMNICEAVSLDAYFWKRPELCFVAALRRLDAEAGEAVLSYTYPADHPLTRGHFPGNPVMMGITQWIGASDALDQVAFARSQAGELPLPGSLTADVLIQKSDGTVAAEISGLVNRYEQDAAGRLRSETTATKRIGFRDIVRPGDELVYSVSARPAEK